MNAVIHGILEDAKRVGLQKAIENRAREIENYFPPSDEPLGYDSSGVMRLDAAIYCLHIAAARILLRTVPGMYRQKMDTMKRHLEEWIAARAARFIERAATAAMKRAFTLIQVAFELWKREQSEMEVERGIRRGCLRTVREVPGMKFQSEKHKGRKVKRVFTRRAEG